MGVSVPMGTPQELKQQFGAATLDEVFVRLARPAVTTHPSAPAELSANAGTEVQESSAGACALL